MDVLLSKAARQVIRQELELDLSGTPEQQRRSLGQMVGEGEDGLFLYEEDDWFSPVASGSSRRDGMIIIPCSMGTLSAVAVGASDTLLERAADVCLKEGRELILVPRETPYSTLHLRNMLTLSEMGVKILPASPAFYHQPHSVMDLVDFVVSRVLDQLDIPNDLIQRWEGKA